MPFLLAEILNFQCALHLKGVGSLNYKSNHKVSVGYIILTLGMLLPILNESISYHNNN